MMAVKLMASRESIYIYIYTLVLGRKRKREACNYIGVDFAKNSFRFGYSLARVYPRGDICLLVKILFFHLNYINIFEHISLDFLARIRP